ncbi:helix-turn-helix domain-containing protein [Prevotella sp. 10(H)]|uniref:helix-turn-helix domain-containing protein n=1 Tax=Prevotella sp. 10(H) TaxID=1158294 RepID=UPI0004A77686|nr:helix-turn-helix domain-containing protein [Prevotella sp. 10(H)]
MEIQDSKFDDSLKHFDERLDELFGLLKAKNRLNGETILDNQDICIMFKLTPRSLQRYRAAGELPFIRVAGKPFYYESEVFKFLNKKRQNRDGQSGDKGEEMTIT